MSVSLGDRCLRAVARGAAGANGGSATAATAASCGHRVRDRGDPSRGRRSSKTHSRSLHAPQLIRSAAARTRFEEDNGGAFRGFLAQYNNEKLQITLLR